MSTNPSAVTEKPQWSNNAQRRIGQLTKRTSEAERKAREMETRAVQAELRALELENFIAKAFLDED